MTCQTHFYNSHTKRKITHSAAAVDSTGCICSSSPSLPVVCRQTSLYHIASSLCICPSCVCMCSHLPPRASSPQVEVRVASHPSLKFIHLHMFLERSHHSFFLPLPLPHAVEICISLSATALLLFICLKIEMSSCIFSYLWLAGAAQEQEFSRAMCEPNVNSCVIILNFYHITDMV